MKRTYAIVMALFVFTATKVLYAQCTDEIALPLMFVEKSTTNERTTEFFAPIPSKFEKLIAENGKQDIVINYTQKAMQDLFARINIQTGIGVRIYFARYDTCSATTLPRPVQRKQLILLFATEFKNAAPTDYFFVNGNDDSVYQVTKSCAEKWINDYFIYNQPGLRQTIDGTDKDNKDTASPVGYSDTKSIFYRKGQIDSAFNKEEAYQLKKHKITITGYQMSFSAYTSEGDSFKRFKNRLHVQFNYVYELNGKKEILYLDEQEDYDCRFEEALKENTLKKGKTGNKLSLTEKRKLLLLNKGQLCPTHCPE